MSSSGTTAFNQNMFQSRFQIDNSLTFNITHDILINETLYFDDNKVNSTIKLIGSPTLSTNKSYIEISNGNVMELRAVLVYKQDIQIDNIHFTHSRVIGAILNIQGKISFHNCKFTEHMHVPGSGIYNFGGI